MLHAHQVHGIHRTLQRCWHNTRRSRPGVTRLALAFALALGVSSSLGPAPTLASTIWQGTVGAQSKSEGVQALAFLPNELWIDAGDSITWRWDADEPHTFSLGNLTGVTINTPPECNGAPTTSTQCLWDGTSAVTSGLQEDGAQFTVTFANTGDVAFRCLLHSNMTGTLHVQAAGAKYPRDQASYDREAKRQSADLLQLGRKVLDEDRQQAKDQDHDRVIVGGTEPIVTTTGGRQSVFTPRFVRPDITIPVGQKVTFVAPDALAPHTVTFGDEPANPFPPANLTGPGEATTLTAPYPQLKQGPTVSAGAIGDGASGHGSTFVVTFAAPGLYQYYCAIHDELGMVGTVRVTARDRGDRDDTDRGDRSSDGNVRR